ncbi:MAG: CheR family methyltransferase [Bacteroidota bacterium]
MAFTFFFRDRHTLEQLVKVHLAANPEGNIKVWDAGCAMGPEPYTFAIILSMNLGNEEYKKRVKIYASDIDETSNFEETVKKGIYPYSDLSRMPENVLEEYFHPAGMDGFYKINDFILSSMDYQRHDLLTLEPIDKDFDIIICKNVLLHFQPDQRIEVIKMFQRVLKPGGLLVTEQTQKMPDQCSGLFDKTVTDANIFRKI